MVKIKVLLIEDNRLLREGTTALLNEQEDIQAVSSPGNKKALELAKATKPDVVLLDLGLKTNSSLNVLEAIRQKSPGVEVIVMDLLPAQTDAAPLLTAGVSGFVPRDATLDVLLHTIRSVVKGVKVLPPTIANSVFSHIVERAVQGGSVDRVIEAVKLTDREHEVFNLLAKNKSVAETSRVLELSAYVVKGYIRNIMDKLALHTRLELASFVDASPADVTKPRARPRKPR